MRGGRLESRECFIGKTSRLPAINLTRSEIREWLGLASGVRHGNPERDELPCRSEVSQGLIGLVKGR